MGKEEKWKVSDEYKQQKILKVTKINLNRPSYPFSHEGDRYFYFFVLKGSKTKILFSNDSSRHPSCYQGL